MGSPDPYAAPRDSTVSFTLTKELQIVVGLAVREAFERGHGNLYPVHLLWVLAAHPRCAALLRAMGVDRYDLAASCERILAHVWRPAEPPRVEEVRPNRDVVVLLTRAMLMGNTEEALLRALAEPGLGGRASFWLWGRCSGSTLLWARRRRASLPDPIPPPIAPGQLGVILHNDAKTSMEFVLTTLCETLGMSRHRALQVMLEVDLYGSQLAVVLDAADAHARVAQLTEEAEAAGFPLAVTLKAP